LIIEGIIEKKGQNIVIINLISIVNSPCSYFVICSANSKTQINAIANSIKSVLIKKINLKAWKEEGENSNWRLLDYSDIVIHILKNEIREHYNLEELWGDGEIKKIK
jgi:ribosome-associated protein